MLDVLSWQHARCTTHTDLRTILPLGSRHCLGWRQVTGCSGQVLVVAVALLRVVSALPERLAPFQTDAQVTEGSGRMLVVGVALLRLFSVLPELLVPSLM